MKPDLSAKTYDSLLNSLAALAPHLPGFWWNGWSWAQKRLATSWPCQPIDQPLFVPRCSKVVAQGHRLQNVRRRNWRKMRLVMTNYETTFAQLWASERSGLFIRTFLELIAFFELEKIKWNKILKILKYFAAIFLSSFLDILLLNIFILDFFCSIRVY